MTGTPSPKIRYCFDSSVFVDLWYEYYPPQRHRHVWDRLEELIAEGSVVAPMEVYQELAKTSIPDEPLFLWVKERKNRLFLKLSRDHLLALREVLKKYPNAVTDAHDPPYADPILVAVALAEGLVVVTSEKLTEEMRRHKNPPKPKLPFICENMGVRHLRLMRDLRKELDWP